MQKWSSTENVNDRGFVSNDREYTCIRSKKITGYPQKKRFKALGSFLEEYTITIKPKLHRSNSLSDLTSSRSDFSALDLVKRSSKLLTKEKVRETIYGCYGDGVAKYAQELTNTSYISWMPNDNRLAVTKTNMPITYGSKFATDYLKRSEQERDTDDGTKAMSSYTDNTSETSADHENQNASFPFQSTPSGNLKVQSNQVVFQSSTVGVLLADPTQAKIQVKFEGGQSGQAAVHLASGQEHTDYDCRNIAEEEKQSCCNCKPAKPKRDMRDKIPDTPDGKDLKSLGYNYAEPIDWKRIQLPKKQDMFQEFYRRIHNHINTDTIVYIGDEEIHCHRIILQIYSPFFDEMASSKFQLPIENVTPEAFYTLYEWMVLGGNDSMKTIKRTNVLDLLLAAQYLGVKDLEDQCWAFIVNEDVFTEDTAHYLCREARTRGLKPVVDMMIPRIMKFFLPLVASRDFLELDLEELIPLLQSNNICVSSEIEVLMAGVRWLFSDWNERQSAVVDVMSCVRFGLISPWQLVDIRRNPDNAEILEIVNDPEVQQMVDDGLAYVIIKYWYGNNSKNYYHWIDVLGLTEPIERNWIGEERNHVTYKDFLAYLEQFMLPKDEMFEMMSNIPQVRRSEDVPGGLRGDSDPRRPKMDFQMPNSLRMLSGDREQPANEFLDSKGKRYQESNSPLSSTRSPLDMDATMQEVLNRRRRNSSAEPPAYPSMPPLVAMMKSTSPQGSPQSPGSQTTRKRSSSNDKAKPPRSPTRTSPTRTKDIMSHLRNPPKTSTQNPQRNLLHTEKMQPLLPCVAQEKNPDESSNDTVERVETKRPSVAATFLAAATAALAGLGDQRSPSSARSEQSSSPPRSPRPPHSSADAQRLSENEVFSPKISLFNQSKESLARVKMNKLSHSVLGPTSKNYMVEGSLFNWDRETVLVFGGIDPHTMYGVSKNTGKDIYRFDPVSNVWEVVGELPEPRHHHSIAFLKGRVYLVGGADPRDDDVHGKSVVVSTVWSLEPVSRSWHSEAGLAVPRKNFGLVVHRMALYAIGGQDKKGRVLRSVERFDYKSCSWSEVRSMSLARMAVAAVKYREYIWVAGGMTGDKRNPVCKVVECYNSNNDEWTQIHSLRFPRCFATMFTMNDKLYIIGGAGKTTEKDKTASSVSAIDVWDWSERRWRHETDMSIPRHGHALAYLGTQLCIIGGVTTIYMRALNNVESYCCERSAWIRGVAALPSSLSGHGAVTLPPASLM